jgi:hypothetical protein
MSQGRGFIHELPRRRVASVVVACVVAALALLQLVSIALPAFIAADWVLKVVIASLLLGIPSTLIGAFALAPNAPDRVRGV